MEGCPSRRDPGETGVPDGEFGKSGLDSRVSMYSKIPGNER
jgi:hypothetical protein